MRPLDLQTALPRVAETARVERVGQQGQDKAAAQAASQNQEAARKGQEEVARARPAEQGRIAQQGRGGGRGGGGGAGTGSERPDAEAAVPEQGPQGGAAAHPPPEPGGRLDLRM